MNDEVDDPRLMSVAGSISDRRQIDWDAALNGASAEQAEILTALRALEGVARLADDAPKTWGPFTILNEIGHGAFGTVYRAFDPELQRDVALKIIRPGVQPFDAERAVNEARRLARITHKNVVRVYRVDRLESEVGIAMELISGQTLDALIKERGPLSAEEAALIGLDLCGALAAVHGTETLHGDVKAHNVMRQAGGQIVLMDFGTSKDLALAPERLLESDFAGTPLYLAPEVFAGAPRTKASDIYSLGVLLYFLVSGRYPVSGSTRTEIGRQHRRDEAREPLRDVRPDLPEGFVGIVERAVAAAPDERFASAGDFERALRAFLTPTTLQPAPSHWKPIAVFAALAVIVTAGLIASRFTDGRSGAAAAAATPAAVAALPAAPPDTYDVAAAVYRSVNGASVPLAADARLALGDRLHLEMEASVPTYVYVVNEDERGESFLLFPIAGRTATNPLPPGGRRRVPVGRLGEELSWTVTSTGGREHFVIFVTPTRSASLEEMFATLPTPAPDREPAVRLPSDVVGKLRSIGGLVAESAKTDQGIRRIPGFSAPLEPGRHTTTGLWVRQISFLNEP